MSSTWIRSAKFLKALCKTHWGEDYIYFLEEECAESNVTDPTTGGHPYSTWLRCVGDDMSTMKYIYNEGFNVETGCTKWKPAGKTGPAFINYYKGLMENAEEVVVLPRMTAGFAYKDSESLLYEIYGVIENAIWEGIEFFGNETRREVLTTSPQIAYEMWEYKKSLKEYGKESLDMILRAANRSNFLTASCLGEWYQKAINEGRFK